MATVTSARAYLADISVEKVRTDAVQSFVKQETIFVELETSDGFTGVGYSYTIGTGGRAVYSMLHDHLLPRLIGQDADHIEAVWFDLFSSTRATAVGAITSLSLAAVDTALWDIKCKKIGLPLWQVAGGYKRNVPLYDTEGGWLHLTTDELVAEALHAQKSGWKGIKVKVGKPTAQEDFNRLSAVRDAVGDTLDLMVDANQSMTAAEAIKRASFYEPLNLFWFEEPLPSDDVDGHVRLSQMTNIPIAVGESLYSIGQFRDYLQRGASSIIQVDVARVGGITPWLKVAHMAEAFNVMVCPHFLMELHVSLVAAIPNGKYVEHIPQLRAVTHTEMEIENGFAIAPNTPGLGIDWNMDAIEDRRVL